jgi:REP element-mobilizing transposase RayT
VIVRELSIGFVAVKFGPDHMHLSLDTINITLKYSLHRDLKVTFSYEARKGFLNMLAKCKFDGIFLTDNYFYGTCGNITAAAREGYIKRTQEKH